MSKIINVGRVTSYADAVAGGYTGTREQWEHDLANLGTVAAEVEADRAEVAENTATVAEDKAAVEEDKSAAESAAESAASSSASAHTDAIAATAAKEAAESAQGLAENAASTAANAKDAAQTAQGAAEDAQTAAEAAQTAAEDAQTGAEGSASAAAESATAAAESEATAQHIADMYPTDKTLSVVDKAADGKATGDAVADLKSAIGDLKSEAATEDALYQKYGIGVSEILVGATWINGKFIADDGTISDSDAYRYCDYISVTDGDYIAVTRNAAASQNRILRVFGYDANQENGELILKKSIAVTSEYNEYSFTVSGYSYLRISYTVADPIIILNSEKVTDIIEDGDEAVSAKVENLKSEIGSYESLYRTYDLGVVWTEGYTFNDDGSTSSNSAYHYCDYISVIDGTYNVVTTNTANAIRVLRVIGYDSNKQNPTLLLKKSVDINATRISAFKYDTNNSAYVRISYAAIEPVSMKISEREENDYFNLKFDRISGFYINKSGAETESANDSCTGFIQIVPNETVHITGLTNSSNRGVCLYDSSKTFIECISTNYSGTELTFRIVNQNAKYLRLSCGVNTNIEYIISDHQYADNLNKTLYEKGSFNSSGAPTTTNKYCRTIDYIDESIEAIYVKSGYKLGLCTYPKNGSSASRSTWIGDTYGRIWRNLDHTANRYKFYAGRNDESESVTTQEISDNVILLRSFDFYKNAYKDTMTELENLRKFVNRGYDINYANADNPMPLVNYLGNIQNVHPKVLYISDGFGGHTYWMAYTPYPSANVKYENPCIAYSDNGYDWTNIAGNPIVDGYDSSTKYNSDTHLVYRPDTGVLECWFRMRDETNNIETIYRSLSQDGVTWGAKEELITYENQDSRLLSPAVIYEDSKYKMWVVSKIDGMHIDYYESANATTWSLIRTITLTYEYNGATYEAWHMDCIHDTNQYIIVMMCKGANDWVVFLTTSSDNITYTDPVLVLFPSYRGWDTEMYRTSIVKVGDEYRLYYSARNVTTYGTSVSTSKTLSRFIGTQYYNS